jgi:hypothetical protein
MNAYTKPIRQGWACGYELAPPAGTPVMPWSGLGYEGPAPTICAGYTTTLPETIEAARAWKWWSKGQLDVFLRGEVASDPIVFGIETFDYAVATFERWRMTPAAKGGGAD